MNPKQLKEFQELLFEMTTSESLRRHCRTVQLVMESYAKELKENEEEWSITGLLHDADYEKYPQEHPKIICSILQKMGFEKIAYAISCHYSKWNNIPKSKLDKALWACDEITGFIVACAQVNPDGINGVEYHAVLKKLKQKKFAASIDRDEINRSCLAFEISIENHIRFILQVLKKNRQELKI
ncbi:MAG: HD domain-containing protein [Alphaproteobacteria bacterium]|nr:HD domain-containing protein [Alphaproteobacteria bacterium]